MRDICVALRERLEATVKQRIELEARERRLRALLRDEEVSQLHQLQPASCSVLSEPIGGPRLREFVLGSLGDGHDWSLQSLKEHAYGVGLTTVEASGRALNITLVNLVRQGLVRRVQDGKWSLRDQATQSPLDLTTPKTDSDKAEARLAS